MRRAFIVLLLIASIGCSDTSPVAPSPVAEVGATSTNLAAALQPTASGSTYTDVADALKAPVRRVTHDNRLDLQFGHRRGAKTALKQASGHRDPEPWTRG